MTPKAMTISKAVTYSGMSRTRLFDLIKSGEVSSFLLGGRRMMLTETLDSFIHKLARGQA
jgi:hypothetical protein